LAKPSFFDKLTTRTVGKFDRKKEMDSSVEPLSITTTCSDSYCVASTEGKKV
jgi:hypothetical protein